MGRGAGPRKEWGQENYAFFIRRDFKVPATHFKVRLISAYRSDGFGLGEIEVFGTGAQMSPDTEVNYVNSDTNVLNSNFVCHYRLVAKNDLGVFYGKDKVVSPVIEWQRTAFSVKIIKLFLHKVKRKFFSLAGR